MGAQSGSSSNESAMLVQVKFTATYALDTSNIVGEHKWILHLIRAERRDETVAFEHKEWNENCWLTSSIKNRMKLDWLPRRIKESRLGSVCLYMLLMSCRRTRILT